LTYSRSTRYGQPQARRGRAGTEDQGFTCRHCNMYVTCEPAIAGVQNRNHCPYCLWSRHLDWRVAGDRLAGCRAAMRPVGLTTKHSRNKYAGERDGELMLIHRCSVCAKLVINRIAADDNPAAILALLADSSEIGDAGRAELERMGVAALAAADGELVRRRLFGASRAGTLM
jgi:hypothetical protein